MRRKKHIRRRLFGTAAKPRVSVFRSHKHIYCQVIDDASGVTLVSASTRDGSLRGSIDGFCGNRSAAATVGKAVAERVLALGVKEGQFDRNGYRFHGRVKALVEAAREGGLKL